MTGPRTVQVFHPFEFEIAVHDLQSDRAAQRRVVPDSRENLDPIRFDPLAAASTISSLPTSQLLVDQIGINLQTGGKTIDDR
jgi:hypothetical protein